MPRWSPLRSLLAVLAIQAGFALTQTGVRPALAQHPLPLVSPPTPQTTSATAPTLWAISSRDVRHGGPYHQPILKYWYFDAASYRWIDSSLEAFLACDSPEAPTCFFVHGNRISRNQAFYVGWRAYQQLAAKPSTPRNSRFVIWSWPATQIKGQLQDVRVKAYRSDEHAYYMAWLVDRINPRVPVSFVGYSYGARMATGSLHLLGGGRLAGRSLGSRNAPGRVPMRAVLMAGALDSYSLAPRGRNGRALTQVDQMLVMVNPADQVLKYYPLLGGLIHRGPPAAGYTGAAGIGSWGPDSHKVDHWNVCRYVGGEHDWVRYLCSPAVVARTQQTALFGLE